MNKDIMLSRLLRKLKSRQSADWPWLIRFAAFLLVCYLILQPLILPAIVQGSSMEPTLHSGTFVVANKLAEPERGDIIIADSATLNKVIVKRVIALPGDTIVIRDGQTYLNDKPLDEPYVVNKEVSDFCAAVTVPDGYCFVMGDNRPDSNDSRSHLGLLPLEEVMGTVIVHLF